jgi:hypothetical protein
VSRRPSEFFAPAPLAAVALLGVNDHLLKPLLHDALTGKLSDLALAFFLPLLISALLRPLWAADRSRLLAGALLAAALFTVLELSLTADRWFSAALATLAGPFGIRGAVFTRDPSDLLALALVPVAVWYGRRRLAGTAPAPSRVIRAAALVATSLLLAATSRLPDCDRWAAPVTFRVEGDCGPPGVVVVEGNGALSLVTVYNGDAVFGAAMGPYRGGACPIRLAEGGWTFTGRRCTGGADAGTGDGGAACEAQRTCRAALDGGGELWVTCETEDGRTGCRSRLTLVQE